VKIESIICRGPHGWEAHVKVNGKPRCLGRRFTEDEATTAVAEFIRMMKKKDAEQRVSASVTFSYRDPLDRLLGDLQTTNTEGNCHD
jgi:cytochrome P450